jgi:hypothetical protein
VHSGTQKHVIVSSGVAKGSGEWLRHEGQLSPNCGKIKILNLKKRTDFLCPKINLKLMTKMEENSIQFN